ncbi:MAG: hypothetical protein WCO63_06580 [Bacteroidota bacterium]
MSEPVDTKKIKSSIIRKIKQGISKQQIYDELVPVYLDRNAIAAILNGTPSLLRRNNNKSPYIWLLVLLGLSAVLDLAVLSYPSLIWDIALIYIVADYKIKHFSWIWFRAIISIFILIVILILNTYQSQTLTSLIGTALVMVILIPTLIVSVKLEHRLSSKFAVRRVQFIDDAGNETSEIIHEFEE